MRPIRTLPKSRLSIAQTFSPRYNGFCLAQTISASQNRLVLQFDATSGQTNRLAHIFRARQIICLSSIFFLAERLAWKFLASLVLAENIDKGGLNDRKI